jgi:hypothetical protein
MADDRFKYHRPTAEAAELHDDYRAQIEDLCSWLESRVPNCRERSLAITKLEEAMFWANAAIAREISAKADQ